MPKIFILATELIFWVLFISFPQNAFCQFSQTVRGRVIDKVSTSPLPGVNIVLNDISNNIGTSTDENGLFVLKAVPVGRNSFTFSFIGYEPVQIQNIVVSSGKELILNIEMTENVLELEQVTVKAYQKGEVLNKMATISARSFSVEESERFAGSWSDPARMAANFAGISMGNDTRNDIIIRGNSPTGLLWRLEGIDIPNPNHFAVQGTSGGPVSMLNSNLLARSDFFTGAFPAQYGNALAGVFDLNLRNGNNCKHEYVLQAGLNGYEVGMEGPFSKKHNGSYNINWRYSFLDVLQKMGFDIAGGAVPTYTDLNFKFNFPTKKIGTFSLFGLGGIDEVEALAEQSTDQFNPIKNTDLKNQTSMGVVGFVHKLIVGNNANFRSSLSYSAQETGIKLDSIMADQTKELFYASNFLDQQVSGSFHFTKKINTKNTFSTGITLKDKWITQTDSAMYLGSYITLIDLNNEHIQLVQGFLEWKHRITSKVDFYTGIHSQFLFLNGSKTLEPRLGFSWSFGRGQSFNMGYGIHSQTQTLPVYFVESTNADRTEYWRTCENLDFTNAQHFIVGFNSKMGKNWDLKIEGYYQDLSRIPVESTRSNFSVINLGATYYNGTQDKDSLVNEGLGKNYGVELTLEKHLSKNWYCLLTSSLFKSLYKPSDGIWRNTVFSTNYVSNGLLGFEFPLSKRSSFDINAKLVWSGGIRSLYVDEEASMEAGMVIYDDAKAYSERSNDYFRIDAKMTLKHNFKNATMEFSIDVANITDRENIFSESFNPEDGTTYYTYQQGFLPTALIRLTF